MNNRPAFDDSGRPIQTVGFQYPGDETDLVAAEGLVRQEAIAEMLQFFSERPKTPAHVGLRLLVCAWAAGVRFRGFRKQKDFAHWLGISERALSGQVRKMRAIGLQMQERSK